jgi:hypothetical protein
LGELCYEDLEVELNEVGITKERDLVEDTIEGVEVEIVGFKDETLNFT